MNYIFEIVIIALLVLSLVFEFFVIAKLRLKVKQLDKECKGNAGAISSLSACVHDPRNGIVALSVAMSKLKEESEKGDS